MSEELAELLSRCEASDDEELALLVRRFQPVSLELARALLEDRDSAEDVVQETFITALERLPELRQPDAFPSWLRQIVRTHVNRINRRWRELPLSESVERTLKSDASPCQRREREEIQRRVRQAIRVLPESGRRTSELFYLDELSCTEVANVLQVPLGTVKRRLHDSRKRLRAMLLGYIDDGTSPRMELKLVEQKQSY